MSPNPLRIPLEVSQIRHNGSLLDAPSCIFNTRNAYIYKEDKGNQANNEMSRLSQGFGVLNARVLIIYSPIVPMNF